MGRVGAAIGESGRTTATVLFTDLVGSTELRSGLGEQAAEELRRRHDHLVTGAVEAHHGRVVKGLGDGVMATFAGASEGVSAAVAIQQVIDRHNRSAAAPVPLMVRIGLSAGDVSVEAGDCFGTPVIEAARLCATASGGQIVAFEMVRWLVRGGGHRFSPLGALDLKGLPEPVPACEVAWEPLPQASVPLPPLLTDVGRIFVGREDELNRLEQLWKEATAGERRVALVAGEPGVGKTRLGAELARKLHDEGATVLAGRCDEDLGVPFQPFVEALRHLVDHVEASELPQRLGRYAGELERLLPGLRERLLDAPPPLRSDPETELYRLFEAVTGWLAASSRREPVLVILDDLQWAAKPTLLLLRHVARSPEATRLLIVGTYRDTELHHDHPLVELLADLRRQTGIERVSLSGFDQAAVADFMARAAGHEMDDEGLALARAIHAETEGNPFFVREILRHLTETEAIVQRDGRWVTSLAVEELGIPEGVREVVGRRVSRLSSDADRVLRVAAVVGTAFELPVVQAAGAIDEEAVFSAVEEAIAARLVLEIPGPAARHRFTHALVRDTLYEQLSAARRVALHRRVAEVIEELHAGALDDHLPALAHHWARGSAPAAETARAVDYATRAGDRALAQLAHDEAAAYYRQALELREVAGGSPDTQHCELMISLGEAQRRAGDPGHRDTLLEAGRLAQQLGDADLVARAALANRRGLFSRMGAVDAERVAALEAALEAVGPSSTTSCGRTTRRSSSARPSGSAPSPTTSACSPPPWDAMPTQTPISTRPWRPTPASACGACCPTPVSNGLACSSPAESRAMPNGLATSSSGHWPRPGSSVSATSSGAPSLCSRSSRRPPEPSPTPGTSTKAG
jgi:class 3 adenylate cyclase